MENLQDEITTIEIEAAERVNRIIQANKAIIVEAARSTLMERVTPKANLDFITGFIFLSYFRDMLYLDQTDQDKVKEVIVGGLISAFLTQDKYPVNLEGEIDTEQLSGNEFFSNLVQAIASVQ